MRGIWRVGGIISPLSARVVCSILSIGCTTTRNGSGGLTHRAGSVAESKSRKAQHHLIVNLESAGLRGLAGVAIFAAGRAQPLAVELSAVGGGEVLDPDVTTRVAPQLAVLL